MFVCTVLYTYLIVKYFEYLNVLKTIFLHCFKKSHLLKEKKYTIKDRLTNTSVYFKNVVELAFIYFILISNGVLRSKFNISYILIYFLTRHNI